MADFNDLGVAVVTNVTITAHAGVRHLSENLSISNV